MATIEDAPPLIFRGRFLKAQRARAGMTQEHAALRLGISASTWRAYEQEQRTPPGDRVGIMAWVLGCTPNDFYEHHRAERVA